MSNDNVNVAVQEVLDTFDQKLWSDDYLNDIVQALFTVYITNYQLKTGYALATIPQFFIEFYKKKAIEKLKKYLEEKK